VGRRAFRPLKDGPGEDTPQHRGIIAKYFTRESSFIILSIVVAVIFWLTDALVDWGAHYDEPFSNVLFSGGKELSFRLLASFFFIACGFFTAKIFSWQKQAEEELRKTRNYLRSIIETDPACVKLLSPDGTLLDINPAGLAMVEADSLDVVKGHAVAGLVLPEYREAFTSLIAGTFEGMAGKIEFEMNGLKGRRLWLETHAVPIRDAKGEIFASLGITRDITERKHAEDRMLAALAEKEILLKEIHHRVKNNLQVVASLLDLQSQTIEDAQTRLLFGESQRRIEAMSLIHENLYRSKDLAKIDFKEYVDDLTANVLALHTGWQEQITFQNDIRGVALGVEKAIPCGLIINELVTNALRHAFTGREKGALSVCMHSADDGMHSLSVSDDGTGFPEHLDFRNTKSLGMQLVISLVTQLGGAIELQRGSGTAFTITFQGSNDTGRN
jgi:PAS domain S-box-containing protein